MHKETYVLKIFRGVPGKQYWESFKLFVSPGANVISALMEIEKNPVNIHGEVVDPIVWEQGCLEEVCGSCSILIDGKPRQACTALIQDYINATKREIVLAPLSKFPLVRDLIVDRSVMFDHLQEIQGWVSAELKGDTFGPQVTPKQQEMLYALSQCMTCGCCVESCPQVDKEHRFIGPAAIAQVHYFNAYPGDKNAKDRLRVLMKDGGVHQCGQAHNCSRVCPKRLPLAKSISIMGKDVALLAFKSVWASLTHKKKSDD